MFFPRRKSEVSGKVLIFCTPRAAQSFPPLSPLLFLSRKIPRKRIGKDEEEEEGKRLGKRLLLFLPPPLPRTHRKGKGNRGINVLSFLALLQAKSVKTIAAISWQPSRPQLSLFFLRFLWEYVASFFFLSRPPLLLSLSRPHLCGLWVWLGKSARL